MAFELSDCLYEGVCIVRIEGRLLMGPASDAFRRYLQRRLEDGIRLFVVMSDKFELADSTGVGDLVSAVSRIKSRGGRIIFTNVVSVHLQFNLSQLKGFVEI